MIDREHFLAVQILAMLIGCCGVSCMHTCTPNGQHAARTVQHDTHARTPLWSGLQCCMGPAVLAQEVSVLSRVRHRNIVRFYGCCLHPPPVFIVEELMEQDLSSLVHSSSRLLELDDVLR